MVDATGGDAQLHQWVELIAVQYDVRGVPHEPDVHAEEVFAQVGVLFELVQLAQVVERQQDGPGVNQVQDLDALGEGVEDRHHDFNDVDVGCQGEFLVGCEDCVEDWFDKRGEFLSQSTHAGFDEFARALDKAFYRFVFIWVDLDNARVLHERLD